ncbi:hypothetical protein [Halococcoides cellulosivorans]|uniref:Histidine kinase n=1 Tax=Halococcoides cellulosivorans TaxID=1679096 RepID=A0A2R4X475_9EURY|nr:hypothetical protein [Halococcoides cellulosivorans]AWB28604.1 hypothetical protein HARCEL1_02280 [Halococcoides cellulosivorans]
MATEQATGREVQNANLRAWLAGAAGGVVGSLGFGAIMYAIMAPPLLTMAIPAMYGIAGPAPAIGWVIHVFHGVTLAIAYVAIVSFSPLDALARRLDGAIGLGIAYGVLTTIGLAVVVMPLWLSAVGFAGAPAFPNVSVPGTLYSTLGHVVYAIPVAVAYALVTE